MAKIMVEIEVPDGKYCRTCEYCKYVASDFAVCHLFDNAIILQDFSKMPERCWKCIQAEVEDEQCNS